MRIKNCGKKSRGFTLLEVMIAVAILAIGFVVLLQAHITNLKMAAHLQLRTKAILLAEKKMAEIESGKTKNAGSRNGDFGELFPEFCWEESITPVTGASGLKADFLRAQVVVYWEEGAHKENVRFVTYLVE